MKRTILMCTMYLVSASILFCKENPWGTYTKPTETITLAWTRYAIEGYALPTSIKPGETIKIFVSVCDSGAQHKNYTLKIFRVPDTTIAVYTYPNVISGRFYYLHDSTGAPIGLIDYSRRPVEFRNGCTRYWDSSAISFSVPTNWQSGLYYAQLEHQSSTVFQKYYYVPFIVRASNPGTTSKILFKYDFITNQAYSFWGGGSLYSSSQDGSLIVTDTIAIDRPMWFALSQSIKFGYANDFIKTLEDIGMVMEYCNNIDIDSLSLGLSFLSNYKTLVLWQHDEYWSQNERGYTESFLGKNGSNLHNNLARFAQNTCYWRMQWLNNAHLQLRCDKWWKDIAYSQMSRFRDLTPINPEGKFLGSQYEHYYNDAGTEQPSDSVIEPSHWIFRGLNLNYGDTLGYGFMDSGKWIGILGTELDNTTQQHGKADYPTTILAKRHVRSYKDGGGTDLVLHQMMYYEDTTTNARVYGLGSGALSNALYPYTGNDRVNVQKMVVNIMSHFAEQKYIGNVYAAYDNPVRWNSNIRLDGNVSILFGKRLQIESSPTVTIDSVFSVKGELLINNNANVTLNGSGSLNINSGGVLRIKSGATLTINPATFILEKGGSIIYESGAKLVLKNATIKDSATLLVSSSGELDVVSGGTIAFGVKSNLYSYGKVLASKAIFTSIAGSSAGSWGNIVFDGNGADASVLDSVTMQYGGEIQCLNGADPTVQYSTLKNNTEGIYLNASSPLIQYTTMQNLTTNGIYGTSSGAPRIYDNTITRTGGRSYSGINLTGTNGFVKHNTISGFQFGIYANGGAVPTFSRSNYTTPNPNNQIIASTFGVRVAYGSSPVLGDMDNIGSNNSIHDNITYNIYATNSSTVLAEENWFGCATPKIAEDGSSFVSHEAMLDTDPWGSSCAGMNGVTAEAILVSPWTVRTGRMQLVNGVRMKMKHQLNDALGCFRILYDSGEYPVAALAQIMSMAGDSIDAEIDEFFRSRKENLSDYQPLIKLCLAKLSVQQGDNAAGKQLYSDIISQYPQSREARSAYLEQFYIALHTEKNEVSAAALLKEMQQKFTGEDIEFAQHLFETAVFIQDGTDDASQNAKSMVKKSIAGSQTIPSEFRLFDNYPNPFNPSTIIRYSLADAGNVRLMVYDYLGREVTVLQDGVAFAGLHEVQFNAEKLSSGIYFYTIMSGRNTATKKMLLLK